MSLFGANIGGTKQLVGKATMRIESPRTNWTVGC